MSLSHGFQRHAHTVRYDQLVLELVDRQFPQSARTRRTCDPDEMPRRCCRASQSTDRTSGRGGPGLCSTGARTSAYFRCGRRWFRRGRDDYRGKRSVAPSLAAISATTPSVMVPAVDRRAPWISDAPPGFLFGRSARKSLEFTASRSDELDNLGLVFAFADKANMSGRNPAVAVDQKGRRK